MLRLSPIVRDVQRQRCCKRGTGDEQRLCLDYGTTSDLSMPLKGEVRRSPEQSTRQPIARSGKFVRRAYSRRALDCAYAFSHRARFTKTTLSETWYRRDLPVVFMITARLSDLSMPLKGEVRRSPVQSARQPIARSGKFVRRAYSRRALDCGKDDRLTCMYAFSCMLSPIVIVEHTSV